MSSKKKEMYRWQINMKGGASMSFDVQEGDTADSGIKAWVESLTKKRKEWLTVSMNGTDVVFNPDEFCMSCRSARVKFGEMAQPESFQKLETSIA